MKIKKIKYFNLKVYINKIKYLILHYKNKYKNLFKN